MPQVISFPNYSNNNFGVWADAVFKLASALENIRVLIDRCSDGPNKTCLLKQQKFLEELLEDAKAAIRQLAA